MMPRMGSFAERYWEDLKRRASWRGAGQLAKNVAQGIGAQVVAGSAALGDVMAGRGLDAAANTANAVSAQWSPKELGAEGQELAGGIAKAAGDVGAGLMKNPDVAAGVRYVEDDWYKYSAENPAIAAAMLATTEIVGGKGSGKGAKAVAKEAVEQAAKRGKHAVSVRGVHYTDKDLAAVDPRQAGGRGVAGAESRRFGLEGYAKRAEEGDAALRSYFYVADDAGSLPEPESMVPSRRAYEAELDNVYPLDEDPEGLLELAGPNKDLLEEEIIARGYSGWRDSGGPGQPPVVAMIGSSKPIPVRPAGAAAPDRLAATQASHRYADELTDEQVAKDIVDAQRRAEATGNAPGTYQRPGRPGDEEFLQAEARAMRGEVEPQPAAAAAPPEINVGLDIGSKKGALQPSVVRAALAELGVEPTDVSIGMGPTGEKTFSARLSRDLTPDEANALSVKLQQDAIPIRRGDTGELYGPKAQEWGPYNPKLFADPAAPVGEAKLSPELQAALDSDDPSMNVFRNDPDQMRTDPGRAREIRRYDPPRGAPKYVQRLAKNDGAYGKLLAWARGGMGDEGVGWYNTEEMRGAFVRELGPDDGEAAHNLYMDLVAATSAGAKTPANARIAGYYFQRARQGLPAEMPPKGSGYGHKAQNLHFNSANEIIEGRGGLLEMQNPKRYTFAENLKGNWKYATVDKHNVRAMGMASRDPEWLATKLEDAKSAKAGKVSAPDWWSEKRHGKWDPASFSPRKWYAENKRKVKWEDLPPTWFRGAPTKADYAAIEAINRRLADDLGLTPAQAQAALWLGAGSVTGLGSPPKSFQRVFMDRIKATAKRDGVSPDQALRSFLRAERQLGRADPKLLAGVGAGGLLGAWALSGDDAAEEAETKETKRRNRTADLLEEMGQ